MSAPAKGASLLAILFCLSAAVSCSLPVKRTSPREGEAYLSRISSRRPEKGDFLYSGSFSCGGQAFPFLCLLRIDGGRGTLLVFTPSGDPLGRVEQEVEGGGKVEAFSVEFRPAGEPAWIHPFLETAGRTVPLAPLLSGTWVPPGSEREVYEREGGGYLIEGEGFSLWTDEYLRPVREDVEGEDISLEVEYFYEEDETLPARIELSSRGCRVRLSREGGER